MRKLKHWINCNIPNWLQALLLTGRSQLVASSEIPVTSFGTWGYPFFRIMDIHHDYGYSKQNTMVQQMFRSAYASVQSGESLCLFTQTMYGSLAILINTIYSRTSMARTLMARLPRLFRTRSWVPWKNPIAADLG